eukprot:7457033-Lingulodinium_polyedra.AAC.1
MSARCKRPGPSRARVQQRSSSSTRGRPRRTSRRAPGAGCAMPWSPLRSAWRARPWNLPRRP